MMQRNLSLRCPRLPEMVHTMMLLLAAKRRRCANSCASPGFGDNVVRLGHHNTTALNIAPAERKGNHPDMTRWCL